MISVVALHTSEIPVYVMQRRSEIVADENQLMFFVYTPDQPAGEGKQQKLEDSKIRFGSGEIRKIPAIQGSKIRLRGSAVRIL